MRGQIKSRVPVKSRAPANAVFVLLLIFYAPTLFDLARRYWRNEEQSYNAIVALAVAALFWMQRRRFAESAIAPRPVSGYVCLAFGLMCFVIGRALGVMALEVGSAIPVLTGVLLIQRGMPALRVYWLPILYLAFLVPVPEMIVDSITGPLKVLVSKLAESALYAMDYPVARMGVTLNIGKYQMLVADACSGLRSVFSLFALGLIYLHLLRRPGWAHNIILLLSIVPLALFANFIRVVILMLVVYYEGEQMAQGFVHGLSGLVLFALSVLSFMGIDYLLVNRKLVNRKLLLNRKFLLNGKLLFNGKYFLHRDADETAPLLDRVNHGLGFATPIAPTIAPPRNR